MALQEEYKIELMVLALIIGSGLERKVAFLFLRRMNRLHIRHHSVENI